MRLLEEVARVWTFAVAFLEIMVAGLTVIGNEPRPDGSIDGRLSDLIFTVLVPLAGLAWFAAAIAYRVLFHRRIESYQSRDVSQPVATPSQRLHAQGVGLLGLGFQPIGHMEQRWPWQKWKMAWVFTNPAYRVDAALGILRLPGFSCHWPTVRA